MRAFITATVLIACCFSILASAFDNGSRLPNKIPRTLRKKALCADIDFDLVIWPQLIKHEPRLETQLQLMAEGSNQLGKEIDITNCQVIYPVNENGKLTDGMWDIRVDHNWLTKGKLNEAVPHQAGMRIVFSRKERVASRRGEVPFTLSIRGVTYCWGQDGCAEMGIPFSPDEKALAEGPKYIPGEANDPPQLVPGGGNEPSKLVPGNGQETGPKPKAVVPPKKLRNPMVIEERSLPGTDPRVPDEREKSGSSSP
ncbi:MAG: hypothetical protein H6617_09365 [Bdellovibrionaceae bacterium]|nr:hypothetical protein [Bdellovibrionales bacterium]MCB9254877.1 hypothetical protein [Pseudobdellovibrionaceae bacterium]